MEMGAGKYLVGWKCPGGCTAPCAEPVTRPVPCRWPRPPRSDSSRGGGAKSRPSMPGAPTHPRAAHGGHGGTPTRLLGAAGDPQRRGGPGSVAACRAPRRGSRLILRSWRKGEKEERESTARPGGGGFRLSPPNTSPGPPFPPAHRSPVSPVHSPLFLRYPRCTGFPIFPVPLVHGPRFPRHPRSTAPPLPAPHFSTAPGSQFPQ